MRNQVLFVAFATLASAINLPTRSLHLLERQATCPANFEQCGNSLPSSFCCPKGKVCLQLAGKTSTLCCDSLDGCEIIAPILCDVRLQQDPRSSVKTTVLDSDLPKCGKDCCPFGYSCNSDSECVKNSDQSAAPQPRPPTSISIPSSTSTSPSAPSSTSSDTTTETATATATSRPVTSGVSSGGDGNASKLSIIGGVVGGLIFLILLGLGVCFCLRRKKKTEETLPISGRSTSAGVYPHTISHPIMSENSTMRSDFNRKDSTWPMHRASGQFETIDLNDSRRPVSYNSDRNPFSDRPVSAGTNRSQVAPLRGMRSSNGSSIGSGRFPVRQGGYGGMGDGGPRDLDHNRQPSTESINVFADPRTVSENGSETGSGPRSRRSFEHRRISNQTTFTTMMRQAELAPDQPFVPATAYSALDHRK
ncbi:hypothetical protein PpBr36_08672 [Pyricularia pennisetigena]|uniref:hypothetical protein n=1 Tax=Pyricularia pennisetigena TaxID=1578925 RepID=UPI00115441B0|nr:hypothetical protein PpBr36_08672 [Pyricularia pennisetigena]TLS24263.1 hypothetical protein PpBr36_08672 [Pyricularia pennisetigena]